jgi:tetratricopeptide (TPR) repeat protein
MGRLDLALENIDEAASIATQAELTYEVARTRIGRAEVHLVAGDLERAGRLLSESRVAQQASASADLRLAYRSAVADYRLAMGDRQAALATFQAAELEASRAGFAVVRAYFLGMIGVLTAHPDKLLEAMDLLEDTGDRRLSARLLFYGGTVGGDAEVLGFAVEEARASGDRFLMLEVLHAVGGALAHAEARRLIEALRERMPPYLQGHFLQRPVVRWALSTEVASALLPLPPVPRYEGDFRPDFEILEET